MSIDDHPRVRTAYAPPRADEALAPACDLYLVRHGTTTLNVQNRYRGRRDVPLDAQATAFQQRVWAALREIPYGQTRSYSQVAAMIGAPSAVRAVARACATNPVALVVPCHRVVGAGGSLSGYRWGIDRKRVLLDRERASLG